MTDSVKEIWKPVVGYEGFYGVSSAGRIRNNRTGRILKLFTPKDGYVQICLQNKTFRLHRIVLSAFSPIENHMHVNHKDGDKNNNSVENLEWVTMAENSSHAVKTGLIVDRGTNNKASVLTDDLVRAIRADKLNTVKAAKKYGVNNTTIGRVRRGVHWQHVK